MGIKGVQDEHIIVTTHAYLAQLEGSFLKDYTVIIDEDFLQLQVFNSEMKQVVMVPAPIKQKNENEQEKELYGMQRGRTYVSR